MNHLNMSPLSPSFLLNANDQFYIIFFNLCAIGRFNLEISLFYQTKGLSAGVELRCSSEPLRRKITILFFLLFCTTRQRV